jgi:hypothetical protein
MKTTYTALALALALTSLSAQAEIVDVNIGNKTFRGAFSGPLARFMPGTKGQYDVGAIFNRQNTDNLFQTHVGLLLTGDMGTTDVNLAAGLGGRLLYSRLGSSNGGALALGGQVEARPASFNRLGLSASTYYAPSITSFADLDRYLESTVSLDYEVIHDGSIYGGYRNVKQSIGSSGNTTVDNGLNVGVRLKF